jgi:hypothetical protein
MASEELYSLVFDPNETCNLVGDPSAREVLEDMRCRLDRWMRATHDPLLLGPGPVPAPKGARINDPNGNSSKEERRMVT